MFKPQCRITPYLVSCFEKIASCIAVIKQVDLKLPLKVNLEKDALNRSVHSSTWIEGNTLSLAQVEALSAHRNVVAQENEKKEVTNCLAALRWMKNSEGRPLNEARLLKLHALMTRGLLPANRSGRYRNVQNYVVDARGKVIFTPPAPQEVSGRMRALLAWGGRSPREHAIIRSAIFHHEFVTVHPFTDGNGRVARAASLWLLFERGYELWHVLGVDEFFARDRGRYYQMIQETRGMDGDYTHWAEYVAEGLLDAVDRAAQRLKGGMRSYKGKKLVLTPKQEELLGILAEGGATGSTKIGQRMHINRARVNQLVAPLVKAGIVIQEGKTRGAKYTLA